MTDHPTLFDDRPDWMRTAKGEAWAEFHKANPWVYETLCLLARQWQAATGSERCSMKALFERLRWEAMTSEDLIRLGGAPVLSNTHTAYYARFMMMHPEFAGLFETRKLHAA